MEKVGIKETQEMIEMFGELSFIAGKVMADGTFNAADLAVLPELFAKYKAFEDGIKDVEEVLNEMSNLEQEEVVMLLGSIYAAVNKFSEGKKLA